jgi:hypothetical protein
MDALAPREQHGSKAPNRRRRKPLSPPRGVDVSDPAYERAFNHLCHMVPLTRTGKVREVVDSLVMTAFVLDDSVPLGSVESIVDALETWFGLRIDAAEVERSLDGHLAGGRLVRDRASGLLSPAPYSRADALQRIEQGNELEDIVREEWAAGLASEGLDEVEIRTLWNCLRNFMARTFRQHGALAAQLLTPSLPAHADDAVSLAGSLDAALQETCPVMDPEVVRTAVSGFFEDVTADRTRYLAQLLDGTFTFFALTANEATARYLRGQLSPLKLFLDTNFIFGLLDLHENPMSEVSKQLIALVREQNFPFTLHYHERTLREIRQTLEPAASRLRSHRWSSAMSRAAARMPWMTGIEAAYHRLNGESSLDVDVFLSKFDHIEDILQERGVRLYRPPPGQESTVEEKGMLIAEYQEYVRVHRPNRPRPYDTADHDIVVWQSLQHQRQKGNTALDVGALFLTADVLFSRFDWKKLRSRDEVGTVVLPGQLLQVLRPFARSTDDFDRRFVEAFVIPEFRTAYSDYGDTASKVLSYITSYKDVGEATAVRILTNELLLHQLRGVEETTSEFAELVDSALANDNRVLVEEMEALRVEGENERRAKEAALTTANERLEAKDAELTTVIAQAEIRIESVRNAERAKADELVTQTQTEEAGRRQRAEDEAASLREQLAQRDAADTHRGLVRRRIFAAIAGCLGTVAMLVIPHLVAWSWLLHHDHLPGIYAAAILAWGGLCWAWSEPGQRSGALTVVVMGAVVAIITLL